LPITGLLDNFEEIFEDLRTDVECLMDLEPLLNSPVLLDKGKQARHHIKLRSNYVKEKPKTSSEKCTALICSPVLHPLQIHVKSSKGPITPPSSHPGSITASSGTDSSGWLAKDDDSLLQARASGLKWNQIAPKYFPSKSANACRKRHERLLERPNAEQWDGVHLQVIAQAYMEVRRDMWSILAAKVNEKWPIVEQKVIFLILGSASLTIIKANN
jgi:hypothetical protein